MIDDSKPGQFYLGRPVDPVARTTASTPFWFPSKQLTTHAVVLGMTGSGKTGLSIGLLEEAALAGVPALCIDPKGDLGNLMLTFPALRAEDFRPWIDEEEAARKGVTADAFAATTAESWRTGLAAWDQDGDRIQRLRDAAEVTVYTPGSNAGVPLALLRSFDAPRAPLDDEALRDRVSGAVGGLLGLLGIEADPLQSREHILLSRLLHDAWGEGRDLDLAGLIQDIQKPPFDRVGVLDLETFFPVRERGALAMSLNNLLASPGAQAWMEGEPLDVARMLGTDEGRPRVSVICIAHLDDAQRMFFVATLLGEVVAWMRAQKGTSALRALLYMDEIAGYFPPTANPPAKSPMLTLLKQARAFGLGVVLATQNPVDLDYKGLANCGTWFIGRLQTERDKLRVLDGLEGASRSGGRGLDRGDVDRLLSSLGPRVFLLHSVHADAPVLFQTRWTLSFLRGPVTREEIRRLTVAARPAPQRAGAKGATSPRPRPVAPAGFEERFTGDGPTYAPFVFGEARVHYVNARLGLDAWEDVALLAPLADDGRRVDWDTGEAVDPDTLAAAPNAGANFLDLPPAVGAANVAAAWRRGLATWLYQARPAEVLSCAALKVTGRPGQDEAAFRAGLGAAAREAREAATAAAQKKLAPKLAAADEKVRRAQAKLGREEVDAQAATVNTVASWGNAIFGSLFGRGSAVSKMSAAARTTSRGFSARSEVEAAERALADAQAARAALAQELPPLLARIAAETDPATVAIERIAVAPRKGDTEVVRVQLVWKAGGA
jgi:hypothetical protein